MSKDHWRKQSATIPGVCFRAIWRITYPPATIHHVDEVHSWHELIYVINGEYSVRVNNTEHVVRAGDFIGIPKGCSHHPFPENHCSLWVLQWEGERVSPPAPQVVPDPQRRVGDVIAWMWEVWLDLEERGGVFLDAQLLALLESLSFPDLHGKDWIRNVKTYLVNCRHPYLDMKELERVFQKSSRQIARKFKSQYGCTPIQFYRDLRAERALRALRSQSGPISTLSADLGYSNAAAFTRDMKTRFHLTPSEIRCRGLGN